MEMLKVITGEATIADTRYNLSDQMLLIGNKKTTKYIDANQAMLNLFQVPLSELQRLTSYDTAINNTYHHKEIAAWYKCANWHGKVENFLKFACNKQGDVFEYVVKSRIIDDLAVCTIIPVPKGVTQPNCCHSAFHGRRRQVQLEQVFSDR